MIKGQAMLKSEKKNRKYGLEKNITFIAVNQYFNKVIT